MRDKARSVTLHTKAEYFLFLPISHVITLFSSRSESFTTKLVVWEGLCNHSVASPHFNASENRGCDGFLVCSSTISPPNVDKKKETHQARQPTSYPVKRNEMETYISLLLSRVRPPLCAHCLHNLGNGVSCGAVIVAFGVQKIVFFFSPLLCTSFP